MNDGICVILAFVLGFVFAQVSKLVISLISRRGKMSLKEALECLVRSGGMPSGHAASFVGATVAMGWLRGFTSVECAICVCMSVIIIYDAVNVRYAVGEQGKLLNEIARSDGNVKTKPQKLVEGHTVSEVIVGMVIGFTIGTLVYMAYEMVCRVAG